MIERPSPSSRSRAARPYLSAAAALALGLAACGDGGDAPADASPDTAGDTVGADVQGPPEIDVTLVASKRSGNAPLAVAFSVEVTGAEPCMSVGYRWLVDGNLVSEDATYEQTFFRAGSATVTARVLCAGPTGGASTAEDSVVIRVQGCADLTFDRLSLEPPVEVAPGDAMKIRAAKLFNEGDAIEGEFDVIVGLSVNEAWEPDKDLIVDRWTVSGMASGLFSDSVIDYAGREVVLDPLVPEGFYYVFLVADPDAAVNECQETNNVEVSTNNLTVDPTAGLKPDVTLTEVSLPAGLVVQQDEVINYAFTVANVGLGETTAFRVGFWLSTDPVLSPETDRVVASPDDDNSKINVLAPGVSLPFFKSYKVPSDLADGVYWLIGRVDAKDQLAELDETNNVLVAPQPLTMEFVDPTCFDLEATAITVEPLSTYWDGSIQLAVTVSNPGAIPTPEGWKMRAFLSLQPTLNPATATVVGTFTLPLVPPGESRTFTQVVPIADTLPVVPHYVGVILDPDGALVECSESNNARQFPQPISIVATASIDVDVAPIAYHPSTVAAGEKVKLEYSLTNTGSSGATAFQVSFVLSPDATITRAGLSNKTDIRIGRATVSSIAAHGSVSRIDEVVIPVALDHTVQSYYLGVVADDDPQVLLKDTNAGNNIEVASQILTVTGAQGGCYEDALEDNDAIGTAKALAPGSWTDLGLCGDADWFRVEVPASSSLLVDLTSSPILAMQSVPGEVALELRDPTGALVATSDTGAGAERLRAYAVAGGGAWTLTVKGRTAAVRASYDLDVRVEAPSDAPDLVATAVDISPKSLYPGGVINVGWEEINTGLAAAAPRRARVWASRDRTLELTADLPLAEVEVEALDGLASREASVDLLLPSSPAGGTWYMLVEVDADDDVVEADEDDNVAWGATFFLDAAQVCQDDDLEPNDERRIASPVPLIAGAASLAGRVVCPGLPDWYAVELGPGDTLTASVSYPYQAARGLLQLELWDPSGASQVLSAATSTGPQFTVPWVWLPGTWTLGVSNKAQGVNIAPYTYTINVAVGVGAPTSACTADSYEDNNSFARARPAGCGVLAATLCNADRDVYLIEGSEGVEVRLTMEHGKGETRTRLYTDPAAAAVKSRTGNGALSYTPAADGLLYLEVDPKNGPVTMTEFPYELTIEGIAGVDLVVEALSGSAAGVLQGEDLMVGFTVGNGCTEGAAPFAATLWLSEDPFLDAADVPLATLPLAGGVPAGAEASAQRKVTIPLSTEPGAYFVLVEADSGSVVAESNEQNNVSALPIAVDGVCLPDAYEPNDYLAGVASAPVVAPPGAGDLQICPGDQDWFAVFAPAGSVLTLQALFDPADGDLDLRLYDPTWSTTVPVATSASDEDAETLVHLVALDTTFLVRVAGFQGASAPYDLAVTLD